METSELENNNSEKKELRKMTTEEDVENKEIQLVVNNNNSKSFDQNKENKNTTGSIPPLLTDRSTSRDNISTSSSLGEVYTNTEINATSTSNRASSPSLSEGQNNDQPLLQIDICHLNNSSPGLSNMDQPANVPTSSARLGPRINHSEILRNARRATPDLASIRGDQPQTTTSTGSSAFSFLMTMVFVLVLWLVVFMVFGSKGHAIAGIFIGLFFIGILINTCFFKFYFRLSLLLGMNAAIAAAEQARNRGQVRLFTFKKLRFSSIIHVILIFIIHPPNFFGVFIKMLG